MFLKREEGFDTKCEITFFSEKRIGMGGESERTNRTTSDVDVGPPAQQLEGGPAVSKHPKAVEAEDGCRSRPVHSLVDGDGPPLASARTCACTPTRGPR